MDPLSITLNDKLETEFKALGFENAREILARAEPFGAFLISRTVEPVKAWALGYNHVEFFFMLSVPDRHCPDYIRLVRATTGREKDYRDEEDQTVLNYTYLAPSFATKEEMLARIEVIERGKIQYASPTMTRLLMDRKDRLSESVRKGANKAPPF